MSHQLEQHPDGSTAFAAARVDAWHRLGTILPAELTAEQVMVQARLGGWNVRKNPVHTRLLTADGFTEHLLPGKYATVRSNPVTGAEEAFGAVVGAQYSPFQNENLCELLNAITDQSGGVFDTAGSLHHGRQVFVTMKLPDTMLIGGIDPIALNLAALNSHDGTAAIRLLVTPTRVVCANTQAMALANARSSFSIRHTANAAGRVQEARDALQLTWTYLDAFQAEADRMIQTTLTGPRFDRVISQLWPTPPAIASNRIKTAHADRRDTLHTLFADAATNADIRGTRWSGLQAVGEYLDHYAPVRTRGHKGIARAERVAAGNGDQLKHTAHALLAIA